MKKSDMIDYVELLVCYGKDIMTPRELSRYILNHIEIHGMLPPKATVTKATEESFMLHILGEANQVITETNDRIVDVHEWEEE